jgi:hypothetical protein
MFSKYKVKTSILFISLSLSFIIGAFVIVKTIYKESPKHCDNYGIKKDLKTYTVYRSDTDYSFRLKVKQWSSDINYSYTPSGKSVCVASTNNIQEVLNGIKKSESATIVSLETSRDKLNWQLIQDLNIDTRYSIHDDASVYDFDKVIETMANAIRFKKNTNSNYSLIVPAIYEDFKLGTGFTLGPILGKLPLKEIIFNSIDSGKTWVLTEP